VLVRHIEEVDFLVYGARGRGLTLFLLVEADFNGRCELLVEFELHLEAADLYGFVQVDFDGEVVTVGGCLGARAAFV